MDTHHAVLKFFDNQIFIIDLDSKSGTLLANPNEEAQMLKAHVPYAIKNTAAIQLGSSQRNQHFIRFMIFIEVKKSFHCPYSDFQGATYDALRTHYKT